MGNPLGPLFANIFMAELEKNNMDRLKQLGVVFWIRYVDDIFVILKSSTNAMEVEKFLNSIHQNIKFTTENEKNRKLPFLDVLVINKHGRLHTEMYRKPTFTGVYLNWFSLTSKKYNVGLIGCLVDRIWKMTVGKVAADKKTWCQLKKVICYCNSAVALVIIYH